VVRSAGPSSQACMPQAASSLSPHQPSFFSWWGFFRSSRDRWRRRNHLQLPRLFVCLPEAFQSVIQGMTGSPVTPSWRGSLSFQDAATAHHLLPHQLLQTGKSAELAGAAVLTSFSASTGQSREEISRHTSTDVDQLGGPPSGRTDNPAVAAGRAMPETITVRCVSVQNAATAGAEH